VAELENSKPILRILAREVVIFTLVAGFIGLVAGAVIEYRNRPKPLTVVESQPLPEFAPGVTIDKDSITPLWHLNPETQTTDVAQRILLPVEAPDYVKTCAWHSYYDSKTAAGLKSRLVGLPIPESVKSELENAKPTDYDALAKQYGAIDPSPAASLTLAPTSWSDVAVVLLFSGGLGALAGFVLWAFYRGVRFAIQG
jgi:hypothetical protein